MSKPTNLSLDYVKKEIKRLIQYNKGVIIQLDTAPCFEVSEQIFIQKCMKIDISIRTEFISDLENLLKEIS